MKFYRDNTKNEGLILGFIIIYVVVAFLVLYMWYRIIKWIFVRPAMKQMARDLEKTKQEIQNDIPSQVQRMADKELATIDETVEDGEKIMKTVSAFTRFSKQIDRINPRDLEGRQAEVYDTLREFRDRNESSIRRLSREA